MKKQEIIKLVKESIEARYDKERFVTKKRIAERITTYVKKYCEGSYKKLNEFIKDENYKPIYSYKDNQIDVISDFCIE